MMSATQLFFDLLPSDLCASSNFRHAFIFMACNEVVMSAVSAGLALPLSVAMFTQQPYIRAHSGSHPFLQATILMMSAIAQLFKVLALSALTLGILLNDGEIFTACAQEDIDRLMDEVASDDSGDFDDEGGKDREGSARNRAAPTPAPAVQPSYVYSCGGSQPACLYRAASTIALVSRRDSMAQVRRMDNPTEVARRCFRRRQSCLLRLRHLIACYPVTQLVLGAATITFWFSSTEASVVGGASSLLHACDPTQLSTALAHCEEAATNLFRNSQLPSVRLFDGYLVLWVLLMVNSSLLLLLATWHYARVDWQMQLMAVYSVLSTANDHTDSDRHGGRRRGDHGPDGISPYVRPIAHSVSSCNLAGRQPCPKCQRKDAERIRRKKDKIRYSHQLRRAVAKEERRQQDSDAMSIQTNEKRNTVELRHEHRVAALEALTSNANHTVVRTGAREEDIHIRYPPFNMPVSPTSMSFIVMPGTVSGSNSVLVGRGSNGRGGGSGMFPVSRCVSTSSEREADEHDDSNLQSEKRKEGSSSQDSFTIDFEMIKRPATAVLSPRPTSTMAPLKPILQDDHRSIAARKRKHVSFPAHLLGTNNSSKNMLTTPLDPEGNSPSFSQSSGDSTGAALTTISEETFNSNMSPIERVKSRGSWLLGRRHGGGGVGGGSCGGGNNTINNNVPQPQLLAPPQQTSGDLDAHHHSFRICIEADQPVSVSQDDDGAVSNGSGGDSSESANVPPPPYSSTAKGG